MLEALRVSCSASPAWATYDRFLWTEKFHEYLFFVDSFYTQWPNATISLASTLLLAGIFISACAWSWKCFKHVWIIQCWSSHDSEQHWTSDINRKHIVFFFHLHPRVQRKVQKFFFQFKWRNVCMEMWPRWKTTFSFSSRSRGSNVVCIVRKSLDSCFPLRHKRKNQEPNSENELANEQEKQKMLSLLIAECFSTNSLLNKFLLSYNSLHSVKDE